MNAFLIATSKTDNKIRLSHFKRHPNNLAWRDYYENRHFANARDYTNCHYEVISHNFGVDLPEMWSETSALWRDRPKSETSSYRTWWCELYLIMST